ncbi:bifunctional heptose 7-phosphate kinase/heptose 1-phosphate adenyltransferase [Portibacter lacus]|uniref:Carbohydrate kinase n=1 Tax=Portibacter lacus TaxID=1099794 RepID=A0AA37SJG7_9BACT|nr:bifunctional ADP-heptose synthase [Portibacter lacus]GLR15691.1 carbohydrate kinase [Portibacter lacus]
MNVERINELLSFDDVHVLVLGDVMLDEYILGSATRISPEAPVPVVSLSEKVHRLGGAANVAMNTQSLGAHTSLIGLIGNDDYGKIITGLTKDRKGMQTFLVNDHSRRTTCKTRILASNQNLLRVDNEDTHPIDSEIVTKIIKMVKFLNHERPIDIIILQDYNKGLFSPEMIEAIIAWAKENKVKTALDPKQENIEYFKGVDIFKPNLKELRNFLGHEVKVESKALRQSCVEVFDQMDCDMVLLTLSADGVFVSTEEDHHWESTSVQSIVDVSGAGDTVISLVSLLYANGDASISEIGQLANLGGAAVCKIPGVGVVDKKMIANVTKNMK